jgi:hypothetical protein
MTLGLKHYFTGKPCKHGHIAERVARSGRCLECERERTRKRRAADPEEFREYCRKWRAANRQKTREYQREYRAANLEKTREKESGSHPQAPGCRAHEGNLRRLGKSRPNGKFAGITGV